MPLRLSVFVLVCMCVCVFGVCLSVYVNAPVHYI